VISFFLAVVVGFADHNRQKNIFFGACGPAPSCEIAGSISVFGTPSN
jgi:hypothetical protein